MTIKKNIQLSIIIINWNTVDLLDNCLKSLKEFLPRSLEVEIIVVDNHSSDSSVEMVRATYPEVILLDKDENLGFVKGNNEGYKVASGEYILLLNSDTVILDSDMDKIVDFFDDNNDVGIITGKVLNEDRTFQTPFRRLPGPVGACIRHSVRLIVGFNTPFHKRYTMSQYSSEGQMDVECATGAYLFIRREALKDAEVFDEDIFMYYEDTLLCFDVLNKGYRIVYLPIAPIIHYGGGSANKIQAHACSYSLVSSVLYFTKTRGKQVGALYKFSVYSSIRLLYVLFFVCRIIPHQKFKEKYYLFRDVQKYINE